MPQLFTNNARALLASGITDSATSLTVEASKADLFPTANTDTGSVPAATNWFKVTLQDADGNVEIVYVRTRTAGSGVMSNLLRGQEGTTARAFSAGTVVGLRITAADVEGSIAAAANSVQLSGNQTIAGTKTFSNQIVASGGVQGNVAGDVSGNAGTVTNGVYTTGDQTINGTKNFTGMIRLTGDPAPVGTAGSTGIFEVGDPSGNTPATMSFHKQGYAINMGLDTDNVFRLGGWSQGANSFRWTSDTSGNFVALGNITANGQFSGNGAGLTNVPASAIAGALNATGSAPIYACRAWVNFNGTGTVAIRASGNVSSITDNGAGDYTVNFTTAMPDANYSVSHGRSDTSNGRTATSHILDGQTATAVRVLTRVSLSSSYDTLEDSANVYVAVFR